jgi:hypothetical protein
MYIDSALVKHETQAKSAIFIAEHAMATTHTHIPNHLNLLPRAFSYSSSLFFFLKPLSAQSAKRTRRSHRVCRKAAIIARNTTSETRDTDDWQEGSETATHAHTDPQHAMRTIGVGDAHSSPMGALRLLCVAYSFFHTRHTRVGQYRTGLDKFRPYRAAGRCIEPHSLPPS